MSHEKERSTSEKIVYTSAYVPVKLGAWCRQMFLTKLYSADFPDYFDEIERELTPEYFGKMIELYGEALEASKKEMEILKASQKVILDYIKILNEEYLSRKSFAEKAKFQLTDAFGKPTLAKYFFVTMGGKRMTAEEALNLLEKEIEKQQDEIAYLQLQFSRSVFWLRLYLPNDQKNFLPDGVFREYFGAILESGKSTFGIN